jgi:Family of unknown function (DUF6547)
LFVTQDDDPRFHYRRLIDRLVADCVEGQGTIGPRRVRAGVWNASATKPTGLMADQYEFNEFLARFDETDRDVLARMLEQQFVAGVHQALVVLHEERVQPVDDPYEGSPFHDFVGRLDGWEWPIPS